MFKPMSKSVVWDDKMQLGLHKDFCLKIQIDIYRQKAQIDVEQL